MGRSSLKTADDGGGRTANLQSKMTVRQAAKLCNVSERMVYMARRVSYFGIPEFASAMSSAMVTVSDAAAIVHLPHDVQRQALAAVQEGRAKTLRKAVGLLGPTTLEKIKKLWGQATAEERLAFLRWQGDGATQAAAG